MATDIECINEFRTNNEKVIEHVRGIIEVLKVSDGGDDNRHFLNNIGIIYNNKISELIRIYNDHGLDFFEGNPVTDVIKFKLSYDYQQAVELLQKYFKENVSLNFSGIWIKNDNRKELEYYRKLTDEIFEFDIEKDLEEALSTSFFDSGDASALISLYLFHDIIKKDIVETLNKLGYPHLASRCISKINDIYQLLIEHIDEMHIKLEMDETDDQTPRSLR